MRTLIAAFVVCAVLAGMAGMAGAVDGMHGKIPPGAQTLGAGPGGSQGTFGTGTGQAGATGLTPAQGGATIGRGVNPSGQGVNPIGQGPTIGDNLPRGGSSRCTDQGCTADWVGTGGPQIGGSQGTFGTGTGQAGATGLTPAPGGATIGRGVNPAGQGGTPIGDNQGTGGTQTQQTQQTPQGQMISCKGGVCSVVNPDGRVIVSYGEGKGGVVYDPNKGTIFTQGTGGTGTTGNINQGSAPSGVF